MNSRNECIAFFKTTPEAPSVIWAVRQSISESDFEGLGRMAQSELVGKDVSYKDAG